MIRFLARKLIPNSERTEDAAVRRAWGELCGGVGILLNLLLTAGKLLAGQLSGSIAATADALNNLSDALTSAIALIGFRLSARRPDRDHPYGHRRYEYIAGLIVSLAVLLMGFNLARSCVERILRPEPLRFEPFTACALAVSILVKLYMAHYNRTLGRELHSPTLTAAAADSLSDSIATAAVLASMLLMRFTGWNVDAWAGAAVSVLIIFSGISSLRETVSPLLGSAPDPEFVRRVEEIVTACPEVLGMHDLMVHDYGAGRRVISLHAEVRADADLLTLHEAIDGVERQLRDELDCTATIHFDPSTSDSASRRLRAQMEARIRERFGEGVTLHDFRYLPGTHVSFDAAIPYEASLTDDQAREIILAIARELCPDCAISVNIDRK